MNETIRFLKSVTQTDEFLDLPESAQLLYFHLFVNADDRGDIYNTRAMMRILKSVSADLSQLVDNDFIINDGGYVYSVKAYPKACKEEG